MANRGNTLDPDVFTIEDLKRLGSAKLPKVYRDFINEGAMDMITLRDNEAAFDRYKIKPRILVNVSEIDLTSTLFGRKVSMPLGFSPSGIHKLAHADGEVATSRAAAGAGISMCLSAYATESIEAVAAQGKGNPYMMQLCVLKDRQIALQLLRRADSAGCKALFLSVDVPMLGMRLNEYRNGFALPTDMSWPNLLFRPGDEVRNIAGLNAYEYDASLNWDSAISWLRAHTKMEIWLKGVASGEDVRTAIKYNVDGIIVSNHGGRQLDSQPAALDALRECVDAAAGRIPVAMDGGIRRGSDIFKALALGACHVFVGRIPFWGLAYDGQRGVELGLEILMRELRMTMCLAGCRNIKEISRSHVTYLEPNGMLAKL